MNIRGFFDRRFRITFAVELALLIAARVAIPYAGELSPAAGSHWAWYVCRSSGIVSYLCIWLGLAGGLMMSSAWFDGLVNRGRLLAIHQTASITGVVLGLVHGMVLFGAERSHVGPTDVFVPFAAYYKPALLALGTVALYGLALVSATFWMRSSIGKRTWRYVHMTSFLWYAVALYHSVILGPDEDTPWLFTLYLATSLSVVAAAIVRLTYLRPTPQRRPTGAMRPV